MRPRTPSARSSPCSARPRSPAVDLGLSGRTAIVCGASAGIGLAIAESLVAEGANVAMFARRRDLLQREADRLGALAVRGDVTNPADLKRLPAPPPPGPRGGGPPPPPN